MSTVPKMEAILRAQQADYLDSARNGNTGAREVVRKPLRIPEELWDDIGALATQLQAVFGDRYVTLNSTLEFLVREGLRVTLADASSTKPVPLDSELEEDSTPTL